MIASLREIAHALGGNVSNGQVIAPGPGHSRRDRSLIVKLSATSSLGFVLHSHAGDPFDVCQRYVAEKLGLDPHGWKNASLRAREAHAPTAKRPGQDDERSAKIAAAVALWHTSADPRGTLVAKYLHSRGLELGPDIAGDVLRWSETLGCMVTLFRSIETNRPQAISRTFLDCDAHKIERKFLGPVGGCAIKLDADDALLGGLHIAEGAETGLAARQLGLRPTWALGSKGAIGAFPVLSGIESLTILAEPDAERETQQCARRWHEAGGEVLITRTVGGKDANDVIAGALRP